MIRAEVERLADDAEPIEVERPAPAVEPFRPFPVDALPDPIGKYTASVAEGMDADPILVISPALSVFAGAIGNSVRVVVRRDWIEPCCLWTGLLALPGSLKTQTQAAAAAPMHDAQRRADTDYAERICDYEAECAERDAARKARQAIAPKPDEPVRRQWLVGDTTPEALAHVLKGNPRGVVSLHDELGSLFGGFGRYAKNASAEPGAAFYKSAFNGTPFTENRKGENGRGRYTRIEAPLVSIAGALQPDAFQRLVTRQYVEDGLASRFLWAWPPDRPGGWVDERPENAALGERYAATYARLCAIPVNVAPDGALQPLFVGLSLPAQRMARTWVNALRDRVAAAPDPAVRAARAKLKGIAFRLALLFHLTDWAAQGGDGDIGAIGDATLSRAILVTDWFAGEASRVYRMLAESGEDRERRRLVDWIRQPGKRCPDGTLEREAGTATPRDLMRSSRQYPTAEDAERALDDLAGAGFGRLEPIQAGPRGGRPTKRFRLSDTVDVDTTPSGDGVAAGTVNVNGVNGADDEWGEL